MGPGRSTWLNVVAQMPISHLLNLTVSFWKSAWDISGNRFGHNQGAGSICAFPS